MEKAKKNTASCPPHVAVSSSRNEILSNNDERLSNINYSIIRFVTVPEAQKILQCSRQTASKAIHLTNERLSKQGYFTVQGRCNRQAFYETLGIRF